MQCKVNYFSFFDVPREETLYRFRVDRKLIHSLNNINDCKKLYFAINYPVSSERKRPMLFVNKDLDDFTSKANIKLTIYGKRLDDLEELEVHEEKVLFNYFPNKLEPLKSFRQSELINIRFARNSIDIEGKFHKNMEVSITNLEGYYNCKYLVDEEPIKVRNQK
mmetsp:Transcript_16773/g.14707  ORF Transcript_16773/g.14707 Transcript_16773/m.14707 type:complete len:164 (-) Transcript_16773:561-1052(-)